MFNVQMVNTCINIGSILASVIVMVLYHAKMTKRNNYRMNAEELTYKNMHKHDRFFIILFV